MANLSTSASCVADGRLGVSVSASVSQGGQSIDGNYTTVNYSYSASQAGSLGFSGTTRSNAGALVLIINGQTVVNVALPLTHGISVGQGITSGSGSVRVAHNADGSKKASIELKIVAGSDPRGANYYWGSSSTSGSITLTNIPRASYPTVSASSKTLGETIGITTNRKSGNFTHALWWICGNSGWQGIASGVGDSYSWTIPRDIANRITSSTSATITIVCRTFSGNTQIGSDQTVSFTGNVPSDIKPSASGLSVSEAVSAIKTKFGVYLKGQSKLAISFSESGSYGSWITSRKIECNNQTLWSTSATTDYLYTSGSLKVTATVTDSRGRSASTSTTVTVYDYSSPWVNALKGIRCNSDGTVADDGEYLKIQFSAGVASVSSKNSATYQLGYRLSNSGNYTYKTLDLSELSYSDATTSVISGLKFAMDKTYDIVLVATDKLGLEARRSDVVSTAFELINYYPDGSGMAVGKFAEISNLFDVGLGTLFRKTVQVEGTFYPNITAAYSIESGQGNSAGYMHLLTIKVNAAWQNNPIEIDYIQRSSVTATRLYILFSPSDGSDPDLYSFYYEGACRGAYLTKASTSTWNLYILKSEAWEDIAISNIKVLNVSSFAFTKVHNSNVSSVPGNYVKAREKHTYGVLDAYNGHETTFAYSQDGMGLGDMTFLACWNGYELRGINKNQLQERGYDQSSEWYWYKTCDGLMVMQRFTEYSSAFSSWGSLYSFNCNYNADQIPDYPYAFVHTPVRMVSLCDGSTVNIVNAAPAAEGINKRPLNNFGGWTAIRPTNVSATYLFNLTAIGPYK